MANYTAIEKLNDGPRNTVLKLVGILDTSDVSYTLLADPAALSYIWPDAPQRAARLNIHYVEFNVEDGLEVDFYWDTDGTIGNAKLINTFTGRGKFPFGNFGDIVNDATLPTGKIYYKTQGWQPSTTLSFTCYIWLHKVVP